MKTISFDDATRGNTKQPNANWPWIPDHPYRILIIGDSGWKKNKTNASIVKFIYTLKIHMKQCTNC